MRGLAGIVSIALLIGCGSRTGIAMGDDASVPEIDAAPVRDGGDAGEREDAPAIPCTPRRVRITFTPTHRAQLAVAIEGESAGFRTIALTEAVARYGIGNRPGAMQMNSGFRWPYGRREGALPFWASRRIERGGAPFPRVIFGERSEGHASGSIGTDDHYFCQPFDVDLTRRDNLDAITCASPLESDKGRFITEADVAAGYAEPFETLDGDPSHRALGLTSAYPPRRDVAHQPGDHPDVGRFAGEALRAMPELDAVTMATPRGDEQLELVYDIDPSWPEGTYAVLVEANTEGDYGGGYDPSRYPTPDKPVDDWDYWSQSYGYPYRGQPSVVFRVDVELAPGRAATYRAAVPIGRMDPHGLDPVVAPMDGMIDDPLGSPGSGADRLRRDATGTRLTVSTECR